MPKPERRAFQEEETLKATECYKMGQRNRQAQRTQGFAKQSKMFRFLSDSHWKILNKGMTEYGFLLKINFTVV